MSLPGVDVSSFQGLPGSWQAQAAAISWAGVKITELSAAGPYVSPDAAADWTFLGHQGKGRVGYLFGHPGTSPAATATLFTNTLNGLGVNDGDGVALDLEVSNGLGPAAVAAWGREVLTMLGHDMGRVPLLYTFTSFAQAGNCAGMGGYPLWIADPNHPAGHPAVPAPWKAWAIHQHSITGAIDRDLASWASLPAMRAAVGRKGQTVTGTRAWTAGSDGKSLAELAVKCKTAPSVILRLTAEHNGVFPGPVAAWLNDVFAGRVAATAPIPQNLELRVPA